MSPPAKMPRERAPDSTLSLFREGYEFISRRCTRYGSDVFATRLMLRKAVCMRGEQAARSFYEPGRFTRKKALPLPALTLLQDKGSAALLDDEAHRHRKQMFMGLMTRSSIERLAALAGEGWRASIAGWERAGEIVLNDEAERILCRAVCEWAGVPLEERDVEQAADDVAALFDGAGSAGARQLRGQLARRRTERWMRETIDAIRTRQHEAPPGSAAHVIASHRERNGELLSTKVAGVELLNVVRPTVAVARYVTFAALALHDHPQWRERLRAGGDGERAQFVQEVRRFYPFFPLVGGRARESFEWQGHRIPAGRWVLLDIYGTNRDPRSWEAAHEFRPERFDTWEGDPFTLIPQGGGDHFLNHRCAGEWVTIRLIDVALTALTTWMDYDVPSQDLRVSLSRMPAMPKSGFVIRNVRALDSMH